MTCPPGFCETQDHILQFSSSTAKIQTIHVAKNKGKCIEKIMFLIYWNKLAQFIFEKMSTTHYSGKPDS